MIEDDLNKVCKDCNLTKSLKDFSPSKYCKKGYLNFCKTCINKKSKNKRIEVVQKIYENNLKICHKCNIFKPLNEVKQDKNGYYIKEKKN